MRVGNPLLPLDRLEVAELLHAAGRGQVVQDRLVPGEALEAHHLLGQERSVVPELDVALPRNFAAALIGRLDARIEKASRKRALARLARFSGRSAQGDDYRFAPTRFRRTPIPSISSSTSSPGSSQRPSPCSR